MNIQALVTRFKEPSTWAGLGGIALAVGLSAEEWQVIAAAGAGICGVIAMFLTEKSS